MPIPLLFIGIAAATGAVGVGKSVKAGVDQIDANETNERANSIVEDAKEKIEDYRANCGDAISDLGQRKIRILDGSIRSFILEYEKLNNVELSNSEGLNELGKMVLDKETFSELKELKNMATTIASGIVSGGMAGALTAFGAYGAAGVLASASTGTAIASLSGAAATNATLAFFGGGSLAAGGLGMAGGTAILGGLVAGPALAVMGFVVGAKASANRDRAYTNLAKAREFREEMDTAAVMCSGIRKRANMFNRFLISLNTIFEPIIYNMSQIIKNKGTDFRTFTAEEKSEIARGMAIAGAIKTILDTPILTDSGDLTEESEKVVALIQNKINGAS